MGRLLWGVPVMRVSSTLLCCLAAAAGASGCGGEDASGNSANAGTGGTTDGAAASDGGATGETGAGGGAGHAGSTDGGCGSEVCDGVDDDCDGQIDEGCDCIQGQTEDCYSGDINLAGVGQCAKGTKSCDILGEWGVCENEVLPAPESCDGKDNDCNGQVDDGLGVQSCGLGQCKVTVDLCSGGATQPCVPKSPTPAGETCDGTDDDCDGEVDEGCCVNGQTMPCYSGPPATEGIGACTVGTQTCNNGTWGPCIGSGMPMIEMWCDGLDNDCDGATDEGPPPICYTPQPGECGPGTQVCVAPNVIHCVPNNAPSAEVCDGKDNDCDGQIDDNCV